MDFGRLNYTLANEDSIVERKLCSKPHMNIATVAGSGSRVVSLLATAPRSLTAFDISNEQIYLTELRLNTLKFLERDEYLEFWGFPIRHQPSMNRRSVIRGLPLSIDCLRYAHHWIDNAGNRPLIYQGRWERTIAKLSGPIRMILGADIMKCLWQGQSFSDVISGQGLQAKMRIDGAIRLFGNAQVFGALMYRKHFPVLNLAGSDSEFYGNLLDKAFAAASLERNFFLQLLFYGRLVNCIAFPDELNHDVFSAAKNACNTVTINYKIGSILEPKLLGLPDHLDAVFLSDIPSYLSRQSMNQLTREVGSHMNPQGFLAARYYRFKPESGPIEGMQSGHVSRDLAAVEKTGAYTYEVINQTENLEIVPNQGLNLKAGVLHA